MDFKHRPRAKSPSMPDQRFPKTARLLRQADFDAVYGGQAFAADSVLVIKAVRNKLSTTRMGLSVSRKVGNAVVRNRWKRRIREAFRKQRLEMPQGLDLVVRPKRGAVCDYSAIHRSITRLAIRLEKNLAREIPNS
ncbi:MAG: ribonuclease P protein component [Mariniblastus sp.]|jgi:ribonuclease P protein component